MGKRRAVQTIDSDDDDVLPDLLASLSKPRQPVPRAISPLSPASSSRDVIDVYLDVDESAQEISATAPGARRSLRRRSARSLNPYSYERALYQKNLNRNGWEDAVVEAERERQIRKEERLRRQVRDGTPDDLGGWLIDDPLGPKRRPPPNIPDLGSSSDSEEYRRSWQFRFEAVDQC
jgi:hypothetical protein